MVEDSQRNVALGADCIEALITRETDSEEARLKGKAGARLIWDALRRLGNGVG